MTGRRLGFRARTQHLRFAAFSVVLLAGTFAANAAPLHEVPDTMAQRLQACVVCHGEEGRATPDGYLPRIAGKPAGYLYEQLRNFREGRRKNAAMSRLLANMTDAYLHEIAEHFATLDLPYPPPQPSAASPAALAHGESLVRRGDASRELPACDSCHGESLTGVQPKVPGLLGLSRDYLAAQMGAWKNGLRHADAPDCMAKIADRLVPTDVNAIANWLASRPVPADARPADAFPAEPPMQCGSIDAGRPTPPASAAPDEAANEASAPDAAAADASPRTTIERGAYLARVGNCRGCHTETGGPAFAGGRPIETPFGTVYGSNLTPDVETGIGDWSSDDFWNAMHEGRSKNGRLLYPAFPYPYFTLTTREDSDAIFAFLRSLPAVRRPNRPHALRFPFNRQPALAVWRALSFEPGRFVLDARRSAEWNRGAYLVRGLGHCGACHSPRDFLGAPVTSAELAGSALPAGQWYAPSLADPAEAGVAHWSVDEIVALLGTGRSAHASTLGPMAEIVFDSLQFVTDADLRAMAVFLRSLPQDSTEPAAGEVPDAAVMQRGRALYVDRCADCHGDEGQGASGAVPALAGNRAVTMNSSTNLIRIVLDGGFPPSTMGNPRPYGMPPFAQFLGDEEVAALVTYLRNAWGNGAAAVTAIDILRHR